MATTPDGRRIVFQCRHPRLDGRPLGSPVIHTVNGTARPVHNANIVIAVTNAFFATPAHELAAEQGIHLLFGERLRTWPMGVPRPGLSAGCGLSLTFSAGRRWHSRSGPAHPLRTQPRREKTRKTDVFSASGPGAAVEFRAPLCPTTLPPYQRAPSSRGATRPPPPDVLPGGGTGRPLDGEQCEAAASLRASYPGAVGRTEEPRPNHPVGAPLRL
ncbi:restriction endonuclease [Streptomyces sp. NPDC058142]|uniref:restriction endonuclease n=1 Tax=Streptomyces sp. NPDC058142 TaxID=3346355 RepID=UPI0036E00E0C